VRAFKALNGALLFQLAQRALLRQLDGLGQGLQGFGVVVKWLLPANVFGHGAPLSTMAPW
jgi:hypothetical protein